MAKPKEPHPADVERDRVEREATHFTAFMMLSRGVRVHEEFPTRGEAAACAQAWALTHHKGALVYGVDKDGRSALMETVQPGPGISNEGAPLERA